MMTDKRRKTRCWRAEFDEVLSEARHSLDAILRDGAIECPVYLYFRESTDSTRGELRLARVCPDGEDWRRHQQIRMNADVRGIMAHVTTLASTLPVLTRA